MNNGVINCFFFVIMGYTVTSYVYEMLILFRTFSLQLGNNNTLLFIVLVSTFLIIQGSLPPTALVLGPSPLPPAALVLHCLLLLHVYIGIGI